MTRHMFVFWAPAVELWNEMQALLPVVHSAADLAFGTHEREAYASLIYDVYGSTEENIRRKVDLLLDYPYFLRVIHADVPNPNEMKARLRALADPDVPQQLHITCHASSGRIEAAYLDLLFSARNLALVRRRRERLPRPAFMAWLRELDGWLKGAGLARSEVVIVGSGALEALEVRTATDLDVTVTAGARRRLGAGPRKLTEHVDLVADGYHARVPGGLSDDELIEQGSFIRLGFRFARPELVLDRKARDRRPKDLLDLELFGRWMESA